MRFTKIVLLLLPLPFLTSCHLFDERKARELNKAGLGYSLRGHKKEALKCYIEASEMKGITDSERTIYFQNVGDSYWPENPDSARFFYLRAAQLNKKGSYNWLYDMSNYYALNERPDSALPYLLKAYDMDSVNKLANNLLGVIYLGEAGGGFHDPEKALKYNLNSYNAFKDVTSEFVLAKNYYELNDMQKSLYHFENAYRRAPERLQYMGTLIMVYQELGKDFEANKLLTLLQGRDLHRYEKIVNSNIKKGKHGLVWKVK